MSGLPVPEHPTAAIRSSRNGRAVRAPALQCVTQTTNNQPGALSARVVKALCDVLDGDTKRRDGGPALLEAFDAIDLIALQSTALVEAAVKKISPVQLSQTGSVPNSTTGCLAKAPLKFQSELDPRLRRGGRRSHLVRKLKAGARRSQTTCDISSYGYSYSSRHRRPTRDNQISGDDLRLLGWPGRDGRQAGTSRPNVDYRW